VRVIERVIEKRLTQVEAARILGLTSRQVHRLRRAYEREGARALASKRRGRPSNRRLRAALRREVLGTARSQYEGFGPTLAHEMASALRDLREGRLVTTAASRRSWAPCAAAATASWRPWRIVRPPGVRAGGRPTRLGIAIRRP
jgi:transposase